MAITRPQEVEAMPRKFRDGCIQENCTQPHLAKGYCQKHYGRMRHSGAFSDVLCLVEGCAGAAIYKGYCQKHYGRIRRLGTVNLAIRINAGCCVEGCKRKHGSKGYCNLHYSRLQRNIPLSKPLMRQGPSESEIYFAKEFGRLLSFDELVSHWPTARRRYGIEYVLEGLKICSRVSAPAGRLTTKDVSELIGVSTSAIYQWARSGQLPCIKRSNGTLLFDLSIIDHFLKQCRPDLIVNMPKKGNGEYLDAIQISKRLAMSVTGVRYWSDIGILLPDVETTHRKWFRESTVAAFLEKNRPKLLTHWREGE